MATYPVSPKRYPDSPKRFPSSLTGQYPDGGGASPILAVPGPYYLGFSSDNNPTMPYNPNFKYHPYANTANGGTVAGNWGSTGTTGTIYDNRPLRHQLSYTSGATLKWALYNNATTAHGLEFDGALPDTRFLHDGTIGYNIYVGLTRRSSAVAHRIFSSMTALTPVGTIFQGRAAQQHINFAIGNGTAAAVNHVGTGTQLSNSAPHCVTVFVSPYGGIGTLAVQSRTDSNALVSTNWAAAPATGVDAVAALKMFDTFDGHGTELWVTPSYAPNSAEDLAWKAFVEERTGVGLTPDAWSLPVLPTVNFIGDSLTDDTFNVSLTQARWCERITLPVAFKLNRNAQAGKQVGPPGTGTAGSVMTNATSLATDDAFRNASASRNIYVVMGGTNDTNAGRAGLTVAGEITSDMVARYLALGADVRVLVMSIYDAAVFSAGEKAELDALNAYIIAGSAGASAVVDNSLTLGAYHDWWISHPEYTYLPEAPNFIHPNVLGTDNLIPVVTAALTALL